METGARINQHSSWLRLTINAAFVSLVSLKLCATSDPTFIRSFNVPLHGHSPADSTLPPMIAQHASASMAPSQPPIVPIASKRTGHSPPTAPPFTHRVLLSRSLYGKPPSMPFSDGLTNDACSLLSLNRPLATISLRLSPNSVTAQRKPFSRQPPVPIPLQNQVQS